VFVAPLLSNGAKIDDVPVKVSEYPKYSGAKRGVVRYCDDGLSAPKPPCAPTYASLAELDHDAPTNDAPPAFPSIGLASAVVLAAAAVAIPPAPTVTDSVAES
jgi:hypothetical protein